MCMSCTGDELSGAFVSFCTSTISTTGFSEICCLVVDFFVAVSFCFVDDWFTLSVLVEIRDLKKSLVNTTECLVERNVQKC